MIQKRFVSETELEEIKKKREEEWKKAREQGREIEIPLEPVETRSLYERLQEQKDAKKEAIDEQLKFKNMIYKGLDEDESSFLSFVADKQAEMDARRFAEDSKELQGYRDAVSNLTAEKSDEDPHGTDKGKKPMSFSLKATAKSQQSLMSGIVIRKRSSSTGKEDPGDKVKRSKESDDKWADEGGRDNISEKETQSKSALTSSLASLGEYSSSDSE